MSDAFFPRSFAVIGTGAVGGYYGALLQRAGFEVHFLLHSDYEQVRCSGLRIDDCDGDFLLPSVNAYARVQDMPVCDVVLVALKTTANHLLPDLLPSVTGPDSVVLTLQNGMGFERQIAGCVNPAAIYGGLCFLCSNKIGPGHIRHLAYGLIALGEFTADGAAAGISSRLEQVGSAFRKAGIPVRLEEDLIAARWRKLVWNIPFNGLCAVSGMTTDLLLKDEKMRGRIVAMMHEVQAAAQAYGREIPDAFIGKMVSDTEEMAAYKPSMMLDAETGRPMEVESIYGFPLYLAEKTGVPMPETAALYCELKALGNQKD